MKILFTIIVLAVAALGQASTEFRGKIIGLRAAETELATYAIGPVPPGMRLAYEVQPEKTARITGGPIHDPRAAGAKKITFLLVEPEGAAPYFYYDVNRNGKFERNEMVKSTARPGAPRVAAGTLELPFTHPKFTRYPLYFEYDAEFRPKDLPGEARIIRVSYYAYLIGELELGNRKMLVKFPFSGETDAVPVVDGLFGADVNGDGIIDSRPFSPESSYATASAPVFRAGDVYFSLSSIDVSTGAVVAQKRAASDFVRILLEIGKEMPDFDFVDFEGKARKLSEFRGRYLLIDFWGLWCRDCLVETPFLVEAHDRFKTRGFEILGINSDLDDKVADTKNYLAENKATWPQASFPSVKSLIEVGYGIQWYPSMILLGPDGKVLVLDQKELLGERLLQTLERTLPK